MKIRCDGVAASHPRKPTPLELIKKMPEEKGQKTLRIFQDLFFMPPIPSLSPSSRLIISLFHPSFPQKSRNQEETRRRPSQGPTQGLT